MKSHTSKLIWRDYFLPPAAAILCYINSLNGDFLHDDIFAIKNNADVTGKKPLLQLFGNDFWGRPMTDNASHKSYRPLCTLSFRLDHYLSGGSPWWFHAVNVFLHAAVTLLFVHVQRRVLKVPSRIATTAALFFAVHPVHTEAVTGIVGRADLLSGLGLLTSVYCYASSLGVVAHDDTNYSIAQVQRSLCFCLAILSGFAAMLCKEHGITALGVCILWDAFVFSRNAMSRFLHTKRMDKNLWHLVRRVALLACLIILSLIFRLWIMGGQMPFFLNEDNPASFSNDMMTRVLTFNYLIACNVWLLLCPRVLSYDWQVGSIPLVTDFGDVRNLATLAVYVFLGLASWRCLQEILTLETVQENNDDRNNNVKPVRHKGKDNSGMSVLVASLVLTALPFLPSTNLFFRVGFVLAERVLYVPSLGFCLLVAYGINECWFLVGQRKKLILKTLLITTCTVVLALFVVRTWSRNYDWLTRESLFRSGLKTLPHNAKMHYNYANFLKDMGDYKQATEHYKMAIELYPTQPSYHNNLGTVLTDEREAEGCYKAALRLHPTHRGALINLGNLLLNQNNFTGEQLLERALQIDPNSFDALLSLGKLELTRKRWQRAETYIRAALILRPDLPDVYNYYGVLFQSTGQYQEAFANYQRALSLNPNYIPALANVAATLVQLGREEEAEEFLKRAVTVSQDKGAMRQLANLYQKTARLQEALAVFSQMMKMAPNDNDILSYVRALMDNGNDSLALTVLTQGLTHAPHNLDLLIAMGLLRKKLGQSREAISAFSEAAHLSKDCPQKLATVYFELGNIYKDLKQFPEALQHYQDSLNADSSLTVTHHNIGALYHLLGDYSKARVHYEHVRRTDPNNQAIIKNLQKLDRLAKQNHGIPAEAESEVKGEEIGKQNMRDFS